MKNAYLALLSTVIFLSPHVSNAEPEWWVSDNHASIREGAQSEIELVNVIMYGNEVIGEFLSQNRTLYHIHFDINSLNITCIRVKTGLEKGINLLSNKEGRLSKDSVSLPRLIRDLGRKYPNTLI